MCVYHEQMEMYDFLVGFCGASEDVRNLHGLTPLVLATHLGKLNVVSHIFTKRRRTFYTFGKVREPEC